MTTPPSYYVSPEIVSISSRDSKKASTFRITGIVPQPSWNTTSHRKPYRHRQQDSFQAKEARVDEDVKDDRHHKSSSRCATPEEARTVPPMELTILESTNLVPPIESTLLESNVVLPMESTMTESRAVPPKELAVLEEPGRVAPPKEESTILNFTTVVPLKESTIFEESTTSATLSIESTIQSLVDSGCQQYELGHYERAVSEFQEALQACHSPNVAAVLYGNLGATYLQLGNYDRAKMCLQKCWHGKQRYKSDVVEESMTDLLINLGNVVACENLEESVYWYQLALEEQGSNEDTANVLFNLGRVYAQHKRWEDAMGYLEQAHAVTKPVHGEHHMVMAQILDLFGLVYMAQGKYDQAMVAFTDAMAIHRQHHGPTHRSMAQSLQNMGLLREAKGDLSEAWEAYTTAHELLLRLLTDKDDPLLQMVRQSIHMVELSIAKHNRDRRQRITV